MGLFSWLRGQESALPQPAPATSPQPVQLRFTGKRGAEFERYLRQEVEMAGARPCSAHPSPWEVVMEAVIELERRER